MHSFIFVYRQAINSNVMCPLYDSVLRVDLFNNKLNLRKNIFKNITGINPISSWQLSSDFYSAIFKGEIALYSCRENWTHNVISSRSVNKSLMTHTFHRVSYKSWKFADKEIILTSAKY
jgi:hypothetical protein